MTDFVGENQSGSGRVGCNHCYKDVAEEGKKRCATCNAKARANVKAHREKRIAQNLCTDCGDNPPELTYRQCKDCRKKRNRRDYPGNVIAAHLPQALFDRVKAEVEKSGKTRSAWLTDFLKKHL